MLIDVLLSNTPFQGWSTAQEVKIVQHALLMHDEFVEYVKNNQCSQLQDAIMLYLSLPVDIPLLRIEQIEEGIHFFVAQDSKGIERIYRVEVPTQIFEARKFNPQNYC